MIKKQIISVLLVCLSMVCYASPCVTHYTWFDYSDDITSHRGELLTTDIDASSLSDGLHILNHVAVTSNGSMTHPESAMFLKMSGITGLSTDVDCYAIIDQNEAMRFPCTVDGATLHAVIDVTSIPEGFHILTVILSNPHDGVVLHPVSAFFYKQPMGDDGISKYSYWINDDEAGAVTVDLAEPQRSCSVISLIEVPSYPLKSSSFDFVVEEGKKVIYARNRFNFWAMDALGRISSTVSTSFTDSRVSREIPDSEFQELTPVKGLNIGRFADNEIRWFKLNAEKGDSLVFRTDRPCTAELFSPDGKRIWDHNGADVVRASGVHAPVDGVYYLAVHDPTSTGALLLDYTLIDRYAVLSHTPIRTGKTDIFFLEMEGNGFEKLASVQLVGNPYQVEATSTESWQGSTASCLFDLSALPDEDIAFDLRLVFEDDGREEILTVKNALLLSEENVGEILVEVLSSKSAASPYEVTIRMTNTGNVPFWGIPFNIGLPKQGGGSRLTFKNFYPYISDKNKEDLSIGYWTPDFLNTGDYGWYFPMMIPYLGAYEQLDLKIGIDAQVHQVVGLYVWTGEPWSEEFKKLKSPDLVLDELLKPQANYLRAVDLCLYSVSAEDSTFEEWLASYKEKSKSVKKAPLTPEDIERFERSGQAAQTAVNVSVAAGMATGGFVNGVALDQSNMHGVEKYWWCEDGPDDFSSLHKYQNDLKKHMPHPGEIVRTALDIDEEPWNLAVEIWNRIRDFFGSGSQNDTPMPEYYEVEVLRPGDPNDLIGYTAPSGSEYIGVDVDKLHYSIAFENDPAIANVSACRIVVKDRLDPEIFDLDSFSPSSVAFAGYEVVMDGRQDYVGTIDMRPEVNAIAQVKVSVDKSSGDIEWVIESLDPLTLDPTDRFIQGILPVNNSDNVGTGTIDFDISLAKSVKDGVDVNNISSIIFDGNEAIETPVWHNVTDFIRPVSCVSDMVSLAGGTEVDISFDGSDSGSGLWRFDLYCRIGDDGEWTLVAAGLEEPIYRMVVDAGLKYSFATMATDRAGNREAKELQPEYIYNDGVISSGLEEFTADNPMLRDERLYDLLGRPVVVENLSPGIYLFEGRKVIVR